MHRIILISLVTASTAFVVLAGLRLNNESIALIIGIGLGLLASLPAHLTLYRLVTRPSLPAAPPNTRPACTTPPEAVVPPLADPCLPRSPRRFITIGGNEADTAPEP